MKSVINMISTFWLATRKSCIRLFESTMDLIVQEPSPVLTSSAGYWGPCRCRKWALRILLRGFLLITKLREGNVFTSVCHSVHSEVCCHFLCPVPCSFQEAGLPRGGGGVVGGAMEERHSPLNSTKAGGNNPTGILSCLYIILHKNAFQ